MSKDWFVSEYDEMERASYRKDWMTDKQWECALFLRDFARGFHHVHGAIKRFGTGIEVNLRPTLATFDFDTLTKLVVMSHDRCVRVEIAPSGPGLVKLIFHKRKRDGNMNERHPEIAEAIAKHHKPGYRGMQEVSE